MSERYQIFKVFVATDDTSALEYLRSQVMLTYADVYGRMLTYADIC